MRLLVYEVKGKITSYSDGQHGTLLRNFVGSHVQLASMNWKRTNQLIEILSLYNKLSRCYGFFKRLKVALKGSNATQSQQDAEVSSWKII